MNENIQINRGSDCFCCSKRNVRYCIKAKKNNKSYGIMVCLLCDMIPKPVKV